ncbi:hypothetical protein [Actinoplanes derwentensis]|uniref:Lipoprotein n=1 Tax=Actinoplanes derwentensis TaxID=113562 RepID=A0A1H1ZJD6_9ACTN|nr:hypothetical protein [Actinoplanes derwentensis]GID82468.1 hypothetical protein Ade03nite_13920 [Actinoplanes derwentensis]SDT33739.1 hypothetical protein SAMN04489716_3349 [Actinoplanes derwentensis]
MRGTTTAAIVAGTLLAISGCASTGQTVEPAATAVPAVTVSGLDEATATVCGMASHATLGEDGYDLDVATANKIITVGNDSKSTVITSAVNVLKLTVRNAESVAGEPGEASYIAEVRTQLLKLQTTCQNVDALVTSIQQSQSALDDEADKG